ncbi:MAG: CHAT domain-containing protein [Pyrinomonadaceae bacterium]|nr:CHAT domain-containing protein [Pyrinomonadaceae bacterium]
MNRTQLAERLMMSNTAGRAALLSRHGDLTDVQLARELRTLCSDAWKSDPPRATGAAASLRALAEVNPEPEVSALAMWTAGYAALVEGQMTQAIQRFDEAEAGFKLLGQLHTAASTQVLKLYPLTMLGRYDEALECGLRAREVFVTHGDTQAAGKIEHNLGNIYYRRDRYDEAERFLLLARERFADTDDKHLALIDNSLANTLSLQHKFRAAEQLYRQSLARAESAGLTVICADIESSLGYVSLFQGRYDRALDYLERARRRYAALGMLHQSAGVDQEIADAYLELNLTTEASAIYARIVPIFAEFEMRVEQARALAYHGRACLLAGQAAEARTLLTQARLLYAADGSTVGEAMVTLIEAQLHYSQGDYEAAITAAGQAEAPLAAGTWGRRLLARWLRGESARAAGHQRAAKELLEATLRDAEQQSMPQVALRCHTSLGLLYAAEERSEAAEAAFKHSVALIEELRAPLPAEEFRTAFVTDKLTPYVELMRLCLRDGNTERDVEALGYAERARSRTLVEMMSGAPSSSAVPRFVPRDPVDAELLGRVDELREELNWFYSQINRPPDGKATREPPAMQLLNEAVREREGAMLEVMRQLRARGEDSTSLVESFDISQLQRDLGDDTALVEYTSLDGQLLAFVVTDEGVEVIRDLGTEEQVTRLLEGLHFQLGALRYGAERVRAHLDHLTARTRHYLNALYNLLLKPVEARLAWRRLLIVPHRALHYVPFHALHDGDGYVIERCEVCYAPSAGVLRRCLMRPKHSLRRALLLGVSDGQTPRVLDEIAALAPLFAEATVLTNEAATLSALYREAPAADVVHLACHGQFRSDNPLFSSLQLSDGWLTVRDAYDLNLNCGLVVLSACETGMSAVAPGDELTGLARGFLSAGASSLLLSLWTVDDEATADLMTDVYTRLVAGERPAAALRHAQCRLLRERSHPFFWSPFMLVGRW